MVLVPAVRPPASLAPDAAPVRVGRSGAPVGRRVPGWVLPVAGAVLLGGVLVAALLVGGGRPAAPAAGLADAGAVTGWGRPAVDLLIRVLAVLTVGQLTYAALLAPAGAGRPTAGAGRALRGGAWCAAGWLLAEAAALVLTTSAVLGVPVTGVSPQDVVLLAGLPLGRASVWVGLLLLAVVAGAALLAGATGARRARGGAVLLVGGARLLLVPALGAVVVPVVLTGHSAAAADHVPAVLALSVHVVTASLWVGGLTALLLHGRHRPESVVAVRRFSALALGCVALLAASGVGAALLLAGPPTASWLGEGWARLLLVKTVALGVLTAIGWWHRRRTLPALEAGRPRAFLRLGVAEVALMAATIAVSVGLSAAPAPHPPVPAAAVDSGPVEGGAADVGAGSPEGAGSPGAESVTEGSAEAPADAPAEDMSGHDHGELSVTVLIDAERFHVGAAVRPSQRVTVYNASDSPATVTAVDGSFDAEVPARAFITFEAPGQAGEYPFVSRVGGSEVDGYADVLRVRGGD